MKFSNPSQAEEASINLTPLIDVVFLLLIFFMVSTTFDTTSQLKIKLPEASENRTVKSKDELNLTIDARGHFFLNARELTNVKSETLTLALQRALAEGHKPIVIQSDAASPVQSLVTALDVVGRLGLTQVSIATTKKIE